MVLVKPDSARSMSLGNPARQSRYANSEQFMRKAAQAIIETTRLQWTQPLLKEERSVEERLLDAA